MIAPSPGGDWLAEASRAITIWDPTHSSPAIVLPETRNGVWSMGWIARRNRLAVRTSVGELMIGDLDRVHSKLVDLRLGH